MTFKEQLNIRIQQLNSAGPMHALQNLVQEKTFLRNIDIKTSLFHILPLKATQFS